MSDDCRCGGVGWDGCDVGRVPVDVRALGGMLGGWRAGVFAGLFVLACYLAASAVGGEWAGIGAVAVVVAGGAVQMFRSTPDAAPDVPAVPVDRAPVPVDVARWVGLEGWDIAGEFGPAVVDRLNEWRRTVDRAVVSAPVWARSATLDTAVAELAPLRSVVAAITARPLDDIGRRRVADAVLTFGRGR